MEKLRQKTRDIRFRSEKSGELVVVHSKLARDFAKWLDTQPWVDHYEANVPLEQTYYDHINRVEIRSEYFETEWSSDFGVYYADGSPGFLGC